MNLFQYITLPLIKSDLLEQHSLIKKITLPDQLCRVCARPVYNSDYLCGKCQITKHYIDHVWVRYQYIDPLKQWIIEAKFSKNRKSLNYLCFFAQETAKFYYNEIKIDAIIPFPISRQRLYQRGFNQTHYISSAVSRVIKAPILKNIVFKKHNPPQSLQNMNNRQKNILGQFIINKPPPKRVLIIDDVMTTGASINELAKILKLSGSNYVGALTVARSVIKNRNI